MRFDLTDIRLFLRVAEGGSITRGAEQANMALASASARILGMERVLGVPLLKRERRGVSLTAAGLSLVDHARVILDDIERMRSDLGAYARGLKGTVHILSNTAALTEHLPKALASFLSAHPTINIEVEERESADIVTSVASGGADIGIASKVAISDVVEWFPFGVDRLVVVVPRSDILSERSHVQLKEILNRNFVGLSRASALQRHLANHAARLGTALKMRIRVNSFDDVCRMVEQHVGIGIVPETSAKRCRRSMAIHILPIREAWADRSLVICVRQLRRLPVPAQRLVRHLRDSGKRS